MACAFVPTRLAEAKSAPLELTFKWSTVELENVDYKALKAYSIMNNTTQNSYSLNYEPDKSSSR